MVTMLRPASRGSLRQSPDLAGFNGAASQQGKTGMEGKAREGKSGKGTEHGSSPLPSIPGIATGHKIGHFRETLPCHPLRKY